MPVLIEAWSAAIDSRMIFFSSAYSTSVSTFHKLSSIILPWHFSVGHLGVKFVDGTGIGCCDEYDVLFLDEMVISDSFGLTLDGVINVKFWRIDHHL